MKTRALTAAVLGGALCGALVAFGLWSNPARAITTGALELAHMAAAAVGVGFTDSWVVTCATGSPATALIPSGVKPIEYECNAPEPGETDATQLVAVGDSAIADPASATRNSVVICGSGCNHVAKVFHGPAYCRSDTDDVKLYCYATVPPSATGEAP